MGKKMASGHIQIYQGKNKDGTERWKYAHRIQAEKMNGGPLPAGAIVHHKDSNPSNNKASNLEITTKAGHNKIDPSHHKGGRKKGD